MVVCVPVWCVWLCVSVYGGGVYGCVWWCVCGGMYECVCVFLHPFACTICFLCAYPSGHQLVTVISLSGTDMQGYIITT